MMKADVFFLDIDNKIVMPGDRIAYPGRRGSRMWMNIAEVVSIEPWYDTNALGQKYREGVDVRVRTNDPITAIDIKYNPKLANAQVGDARYRYSTINRVDRVVKIA